MPFTGLNSKSFNKGDAFPEHNSLRLRVYNMRFCPYAERTLLLLALKDIDVEVININLGTGARPEWFEREINPLGKVPVLETTAGERVYDSSICNEYLDTVYHHEKVLATDPLKRAKQRMLYERLSPLVDNYYPWAIKSDEESVAKLLKNLQIYEELLKDDYFGGSSADFVDYQVWPWLERMEGAHIVNKEKNYPQITGDKYPKLASYLRRMYARAEVKAVAKSDELHAAFLRMKQGTQKYDWDLGI